MDDDWDLHAVVRGCATTVTTNDTAAATADNSFPILPPILPSHDDQISFDFSGAVNNLEGLQEIYQEFCAGARTQPAAASTFMSFPPPQPRQDIMQMTPPLLLNMQIQENLQFNIGPLSSPPQNFPIPPPVRPRRRKNQQTKMVRQMTQEELSADSWAWRKYGQKPIKGSPYPRNYYRCSTSKGCAARKQVERSPHDPEIFIVSYSGEHTHPRPTHRSSLAGSTRSMLASPPPKGRGSGSSSSNAAVATSSSSPAAGSSFSPATPSMEGEAAAQNDDVQMAEEDDGGGEEEDENIIMITSDLMNDDDDEMFRGFQDSDDHSNGGGGDFFSMPSPPWTPTGSGATFNSGGGGGS